VALVEACVIGLVAGFSAYLLKEGVHLLTAWRWQQAALYPPYLVLPSIGCIGGLIAGWLVERVAPEASGSGIPQVKALLARIAIKLDLRVAVVKLVGGIIALGSGMPLGREGPTVQVGASLASVLSRRVTGSPERRRQLTAAGAGAGLSAAFNAPIAGFLFVLEELMQDLSALTVGTAIVSCFVAAVVSRLLGVHSLDIRFGDLPKTGSFSLVDIPFYVVLGVLSGVLGALFNKLLIATMHFNIHVLKLPLRWRVALAGLITGLVATLLPSFFGENSALRQMIVTSEATWQIAAIAFCAQIFLILIDYGSGAPGGLFGPAVALGASLGYLVGCWEHPLVGGGLPGTYALVGMGTFFSAVCRVPMTAIVIVFEMTHNFNIVLPLMVGCVISTVVAESISSGSVYDLLLKFSGIEIKKDSPAAIALAEVTVGSIMQRDVVSFSGDTTVAQAVEQFNACRHRTFPVVVAGRLAGIVTQEDLIASAGRGVPPGMAITEIMTADPASVRVDDSVAFLVGKLDWDQVGLYPVVDGDQLLGIVTRSDVLHSISAVLSKPE
jgi:CIC family chloride channel protein